MKRKILLYTLCVLLIFSFGYGCAYIINNYYEYNHEECSPFGDDFDIPDNLKEIRSSDEISLDSANTYKMICEDMFNHVEGYLGKTIKITGYYHKKNVDNKVCHFVGKFISSDNTEYEGTTQSNPDEWYGFEFLADSVELNENDKIVVNGTFGEYEENGEDYIALKDCTITTTIE